MFYCVDRCRNVIEDNNHIKYNFPHHSNKMSWIKHMFNKY